MTPPRIEEMKMVQHPKRVYSWDLRVSPLLPIEPPEIDPFVLEGMGEDVEVSVHEDFVGAVEEDRLSECRVSLSTQLMRMESAHKLCGRISTHGFGHLWV